MKPGHGPPPGSVRLSLPLTLLALGQSVQAAAVILNKKGDPMPGVSPTSWASDNTSVATVDNSGLVTAKAAGEAGITALFNGIVSNVVPVNVVADTTPASIEVTPTSINLTVGQTAQLSAVLKTAAGTPLN